MSYPMEPVLARKSLAVLCHRLRVEFGPPTDWEIERGYLGPGICECEAGGAPEGIAGSGEAPSEVCVADMSPVEDNSDTGAGSGSRYRTEVIAHILRLYGCPTPDGLAALIDEAEDLGAPAEAVARFIGRQFRLKLLRRHASRSD